MKQQAHIAQECTEYSKGQRGARGHPGGWAENEYAGLMGNTCPVHLVTETQISNIHSSLCNFLHNIVYKLVQISTPIPANMSSIYPSRNIFLYVMVKSEVSLILCLKKIGRYIASA